MPRPRSCRRRHVLASLVWLAPLGCSLEEPLEPEPELRPRLSAAENASLRAAACDPGLQIAYVAGLGAAACPAVVNWASSKLFVGAPVGELQDYCVYEFVGGGGPIPADIDMITPDHDADCRVVHPQSAAPPATAYSSSLQAAFARAIDVADAEDLDLPVTQDLRETVHVGVVDTVPDPPPTDPTSEHGPAMAALIRDVACPSGDLSCPVAVEHALGMPLLEDHSIDLEHGGTHGTPGQLARGIYEAATTPADSRRVINLSLGWEPEPFGGVGFADPVSVRAVSAVLEYARCEGALIIAAAGNRTDTCTTGPLMPAALELRSAPSAARCGALGAVGSPASATHQPLVHAVGGVDRSGAAVPSMDRSAEPRLVAAAKHAVPTESGFMPLTGTSVSAAAVSGAAALLWSYFPERSADEIMEYLYDGGIAVGRTADFTHEDAPSDGVRQLDVCAAIDEALEDPEHFVQVAALSPHLDCTPAAADPIDYSTQYAPYADVSREFTGSSSPCKQGCIPGPARSADLLGLVACPPPDPIDAFYVAPLPTHPPCPACTITLDDEVQLYAAIDDAYEGRTVNDVQLMIYEGATATRLRLGSVSLTSDAMTRIDLGVSLDLSKIRSAEIEITFAAGIGVPALTGKNDLILDWPAGDR